MRGVLGRGSGHAQIEEPPTVGEKPRKKMRRLLSRGIRMRHDGRLTARRRTADDAALRASDDDDAVLAPRAADGMRARCRRSVDRPRSRRPSSVVQWRRMRRTDCRVTRTLAARGHPARLRFPEADEPRSHPSCEPRDARLRRRRNPRRRADDRRERGRTPTISVSLTPVETSTGSARGRPAGAAGTRAPERAWRNTRPRQTKAPPGGSRICDTRHRSFTALGACGPRSSDPSLG